MILSLKKLHIPVSVGHALENLDFISKADVTTKPTVLCRYIKLTHGYVYMNNIAVNADNSDFGGSLYAFGNTSKVYSWQACGIGNYQKIKRQKSSAVRGKMKEVTA